MALLERHGRRAPPAAQHKCVGAVERSGPSVMGTSRSRMTMDALHTNSVTALASAHESTNSQCNNYLCTPWHRLVPHSTLPLLLAPVQRTAPRQATWAGARASS